MNHKILKVFSLLLALTLLVVSSGISAVAADIQLPENSDISKLGIKVESDAETVTVSLFAKETMYFYAIYGQWDCPEGLSLTSITANDKFAKFADAEEGNYANVETGEVGYMDFTTAAVAKDEVLMTATYKVLEYGTYSISFTSTYFHEQANNAVMEETEFKVAVKVKRPILYGDANSDGKVNNMDVALLQKYLAKWDVTLDEAAADANGDGKINNMDVALLQKYLAKWDVTLGPVA